MKRNKPPSPKIPAPIDAAQATPPENKRFCIVGIGASAGGLEAFTELLKALPPDTGMGFVLVQHLDPVHESALTQLLARTTSLPVHEATQDMPVEPNHVYVIPPNTNLSITRGVLKLAAREQSRNPHHSVDSFFESLAQDYQERAIGVVLSGTANDGTLGLEAIKAEGGITFAQDESARYDSMPRSAVTSGCVDFVLSPKNIAQELARIAKHPYVAGSAGNPEEDHATAAEHEDDDTPLPSGGHGTPETGAQQARAEAETSHGDKGELNGYKKIMVILRNHSGVDFSLYKSTTIRRRITRRMVLGKQNTLEDYAKFLRGNNKELDALYSDVLISVTSFFRNPEAFDFLKRTVFPRIMPERRRDDPVRVWVLGCSTGQEAYSLAMSFLEFSEPLSGVPKLQIFATDLNNTLLDKARAGLYAKSVANDLSPERLRRFFTEEDGGYRIIKSLREMVVFARQNMLSDPPFSRMDLISCRNLLIYIEPNLQKKVMPTFHYALKPNGCLFLGASESIGAFTDLFEPLDKKYKVYVRKPGPSPAFQVRLAPSHPIERKEHAMPRPPATPEGFHAEVNAQREADRITRSRYAPPSVLINAEWQVIEFRGNTSPYLKPPTGQASFNLLKMAHDDLMLVLRGALNEAKTERKAVRRENVQMAQDGKSLTMSLEIMPLKHVKEQCYLVFFEDKTAQGRTVHNPQASPRASMTPPEESRRVHELETELGETRDYLQSLQEQEEAANEELQASNEEVTSANEELQSINEELETSKEELESTNEELTTVNEEMAHRNAELGRLNSDLVNLQTSIRLPILLLGRDLAIRHFSPQAEKQFNLLATDVGRPISNLRHNLVFEEAGRGKEARPDLESFVADVIADVRESEREVQDKEGHWYSLRVRPYMTLDNKVDGAVLMLVDIDALKRAEYAIAAARDYAEGIIQTVRDPLLILNADLRVHAANQAFYTTFKENPSETEGHLLYELGNRQWNIPKLRERLEDILPRNSFFNNYEVTHDFENLGQRTMLLNARTLPRTDSQPTKVLLGIQDITELLHFQAVLRQNHAELQSHTEELNRFNRVAVGRELRMIELKKEVNELCRRHGEPERYPLDFEQAGTGTDD